MTTTDEIRSMIEDGRHLVPLDMWGGLERYFINRIPPGHFLTALLSNNWMEAFSRADATNVANMHNYCLFLYNYAPIGSYGTPEIVKRWLSPTQETE